MRLRRAEPGQSSSELYIAVADALVREGMAVREDSGNGGHEGRLIPASWIKLPDRNGGGELMTEVQARRYVPEIPGEPLDATRVRLREHFTTHLPLQRFVNEANEVARLRQEGQFSAADAVARETAATLLTDDISSDPYKTPLLLDSGHVISASSLSDLLYSESDCPYMTTDGLQGHAKNPWTRSVIVAAAADPFLPRFESLWQGGWRSRVSAAAVKAEVHWRPYLDQLQHSYWGPARDRSVRVLAGAVSGVAVLGVACYLNSLGESSRGARDYMAVGVITVLGAAFSHGIARLMASANKEKERPSRGPLGMERRRGGRA